MRELGESCTKLKLHAVQDLGVGRGLENGRDAEPVPFFLGCPRSPILLRDDGRSLGGGEGLGDWP